MSKKDSGIYERLIHSEENDELNVSHTTSIRFTREDSSITTSKSTRDVEKEENGLFTAVFAVILIGILMILLTLASISIYHQKCKKLKSHFCFYWNVKSKRNATVYIFKEAASIGFNCFTIGIPISVITSSTIRNLKNASIVNEASAGLFQKTYLHGYYSEDQSPDTKLIFSKTDTSKHDCIYNMQEMAVEVSDSKQLIATMFDKVGECQVDPKFVVRHINESILFDEKSLTIILNCMFSGSCENTKHLIIDGSGGGGGDVSERSQTLIQFMLALVNNDHIKVSIHLERCMALSAQSAGNLQNYTKCLESYMIPSVIQEEMVKIKDKCEQESIRAAIDSEILHLTCMFQQNQTRILAACVDRKTECTYESLVQTNSVEKQLELLYVSDDLTKSKTTKEFGFVVFKP